MQPRTLWVKRDAIEATVAKYLFKEKDSESPFIFLAVICYIVI